MSLGRELIYSTIEAEAAQTNGVERENNNGQPLTDYHSMCAIVYKRFIFLSSPFNILCRIQNPFVSWNEPLLFAMAFSVCVHL